jgi:hypothetical protein
MKVSASERQNRSTGCCALLVRIACVLEFEDASPRKDAAIKEDAEVSHDPAIRVLFSSHVPVSKSRTLDLVHLHPHHLLGSLIKDEVFARESHGELGQPNASGLKIPGGTDPNWISSRILPENIHAGCVHRWLPPHTRTQDCIPDAIRMAPQTQVLIRKRVFNREVTVRH